MANKVKQFRYYGDTNDQNYPSDLTKDTLEHGITNYSIVQLGIQTIPGTQFYINSSNSPIIIGSTGIYELDLDQTSITSLSFKNSSLEIINNNKNAFLIIDILYEE